MFCCWGDHEVVVPSEPPGIQRMNKTAKYWTMMRAEQERCDYWDQRYVLIIQIVLNIGQSIFCSCTLFAWFCLFPIPYMVIILQIVYSLYAYVQGALKQGKKDEHSKHNDRLFFFFARANMFPYSYACCRFVFLITAAFSFPFQHAKNF